MFLSLQGKKRKAPASLVLNLEIPLDNHSVQEETPSKDIVSTRVGPRASVPDGPSAQRHTQPHTAG